MRKRSILAAGSLAMFCGIMILPVSAKGEAADSCINKITVNGENRGFGNEALSIVLNVDDTAEFQNLKETDYILKGCMVDKRTMDKQDMNPVSVSYTDSDIILEMEPFIIESSKHDFEFDCTNDLLDFTYEDITEISVPNVDSFSDEEITVGNTTLQYHLYTPETDDVLPVVIYNHGGGCTGYEGVLKDDCFASAWITGDAQEEFSCYVIAPYRASLKDDTVNKTEEMEAVKAAIDQLVEAGKVDASRIYMGGESMGCMYTAQFANKYPSYLAAAILMDGGPMELSMDESLEDTVKKDLNSPYSDEELKALAESGTAVNIVQGVGDTLSIPIRLATVYEKLVGFGMEEGKDVVWTPYSADKYNELLKCVTKIYHIGKDEAETVTDPITGEETWQDGLFHNTSRVTAWDPDVRSWLAEQKLEK